MNAPIRMTALALLLLGADVHLGFAEARSSVARDEVDFYIATHGEVRPEQDPQVANAHRVFARVRAVADKNSKRLPRLVVVNSRADPWAIALPSGHVVLSKEAVAICHTQASLAEAEARLAFVMGHELAHLAHDDFWHQEVYGFLAARTGGTRGLADFMQSHQTSKDRELAADDKGFIYAGMAGYPVETLVKTRAGKPDFFAFWMQQTNARVQSVHASAADRAGLLQQRLRDVQNKLGFFEFGVRLSHFDYCDDAVYFFQEFQRTFPGREVLNNLGNCYLQLARQEMDPGRAYFYWLPLILDGETRARGLLRAAPPGAMLKTLKQAASGEAEGYLNHALDYLKEARDADPSYLPARLNLAVAYLYLGQPQQAAAVLGEARELAADDLTIQGLEPLALYESSDAGLDLWPTAVARLEKLAAAADAPTAVKYNLARLLSVGSPPSAASGHWNSLAGMNTLLPAPIQMIVCQEQSVEPAPSCQRSSTKSVQRSPWRWPLPLTGFEGHSPEAMQTTLRGWQAIDFDWVKDKLHGHIYRRPDGLAEVLELDQFVQMQVLRGEGLGRARDLGAHCAQRLKPRELSQGVVWSCDDWAALSSGDEVQEVWWVAK